MLGYAKDFVGANRHYFTHLYTYYRYEYNVILLFIYFSLKQVSLPLNRVPWTSEKNLNTIFAFKFWTCFTIACDDDDRTQNLTIIAKLIEVNPQLEKLHIQFSTASVLDMGILFVALVASNLQSIAFFLPNNPCLPRYYAYKIGSILKPLPNNNSVRRLEIIHFKRIPEPVDDEESDSYTYSDLQEYLHNEYRSQTLAIEFCSFCMKYFRNIHYLNAEPCATSEADVIFKYQVCSLTFHTPTYYIIRSKWEMPHCMFEKVWKEERMEEYVENNTYTGWAWHFLFL